MEGKTGKYLIRTTGKPVDTGRIPVLGEGMTTEVSGHDHSGAGRSEKAVSDLYGQQEDIAKKYTALTFDDGPNPKYTKPLLDGLRERGNPRDHFSSWANASTEMRIS